MKIFIEIGYTIAFIAIGMLFYFEYDNYHMLRQKVYLKDYAEQLDRISNKRDILISYYETVNNPYLASSLAYCYSMLQDMDFLDYEKTISLNHLDIRNLDGVGECSPDEPYSEEARQTFYSKLDIPTLAWHKHLYLGNQIKISDTFETILYSAEQHMTAFIEFIEEQLNEGESNV